MRFDILGPLEVRSDHGFSLFVSQPRYRGVLCVLLLYAGNFVPKQRLAAEVWGTDMPGDPAGALRTCMHSLRKTPDFAGRLRTRQGGYTFSLRDDDVLDLRSFQELKAAGLQAAERGDHRTAARTLQQALDLWRKPPLADFPDGAIQRSSVDVLLEQRAHAWEALVDSRMALGQHRDLVASLREQTHLDPLSERCWEQLMLALYRSGMQAAALEAYSQVRTVLAEERGLEPGPGLRVLQKRILAADFALNRHSLTRVVMTPSSDRGAGPALRSAEAAALAESGWVMTATPGPVVPQELPGTVSHFTGRGEELATLTRLLGQKTTEAAGTVIILAICGTAGVGKTALARQWAQQAAKLFPDGQLYVNLRGYDPGQPITAGNALTEFLRSLGVPRREIPVEDEERGALYRRLVAGRRMVIVLDNAREVEHVRPLLPGTPTCMSVVTSRDALAGLVAKEGAHRLELDMLPLADAVSLLADLIGQRAAVDPGATAALAERCCRLPLALRIAAELAVAQPAVPLADLARELATQRQLDLLDAAGDPRTALRTVFSWSIGQLDADAARGFRLFALNPGPELDSYAAAALFGSTTEQADRLLKVLARAYLIQPARPNRYGMHDLLRQYARELAVTRDRAAEPCAACPCVLDRYVQGTRTAVD